MLETKKKYKKAAEEKLTYKIEKLKQQNNKVEVKIKNTRTQLWMMFFNNEKFMVHVGGAAIENNKIIQNQKAVE